MEVMKISKKSIQNCFIIFSPRIRSNTTEKTMNKRGENKGKLTIRVTEIIDTRNNAGFFIVPLCIDVEHITAE
jgi:hypothetical protein